MSTQKGTTVLTKTGPTPSTTRVTGPLPPRGQGVTILTSASQLLTPPLRLAESVRLPVEDQDVRPVRNPVQQGRGQGCVPEHLLPAGKLQIAGDDQAPRLVPLRHELEEQRRPVFGKTKMKKMAT